MTKGKPWTAEEEAHLKQLVETNQPLNIVAAKLGKSEQAIIRKIERLGLKEVVVPKGSQPTTSEILLPNELPSVEEALKILAGALEASKQPGLDKVEVQRLQVVATLARTYKELLADYIDYRGIETKLIEMEEKYARLAEKAKSNEKKPGNATMAQSTTQ